MLYRIKDVPYLYGLPYLQDKMLSSGEDDVFQHAASYVLSQNLVHGDAETMKTHDGDAIAFAEWGYLGKGKYQRRDFRYDVMTKNSVVKSKDSLMV